MPYDKMDAGIHDGYRYRYTNLKLEIAREELIGCSDHISFKLILIQDIR